MAAPTIRGQGNGPFNQTRPSQPVRRGQSVPYDVNGKPQGPIAGALSDGDYGDIVVSGTGTVFSFDTGVVTAFARTLLDDASSSAARTTLGLVTIASSGSASDLTTGTVAAARMPAFSGDASSSAGSTSLTLATVNSNTGTFGGATTSAQISVNAKGLITGVTAVPITPAFSSITGKPTTLAGYGITDAQGLNANLTAIAGLTTAADKMIYWTGSGTAALLTVSAANRTALSNLSGTNTGDQTITLTGDVTGSGTGSFAATIGNNTVTYAKMQDVSATNRFLGRITAGAGDPEELTAAQAKTILALVAADIPNIAESQVTNLTSDLALKAPLASPAFTGTWTASGRLGIANTIQVTGATNPSSGVGMELGWLGTTSRVQSFDRSGGTYQPLQLSASQVDTSISGSVVVSVTSTGLSVTGASLSTGNQLISGTGAQGYATGSGGSVIQATSKATGVTLDKTNGQVVTHNAALASAAVVSFTVSNAKVAATDTIILNLASGNVTAGTYRYWIDKVSAGSFVVAIENRSAGSLSEALTFNFAVVKAVTS